MYSIYKLIDITATTKDKEQKKMISVKIRKTETFGLELPLHTQQVLLEEENQKRKKIFKILSMSPAYICDKGGRVNGHPNKQDSQLQFRNNYHPEE